MMLDLGYLLFFLLDLLWFVIIIFFMCIVIVVTGHYLGLLITKIEEIAKRRTRFKIWLSECWPWIVVATIFFILMNEFGLGMW